MTLDVAFELRQVKWQGNKIQVVNSKVLAVRGKKLDEYHRVFALGTDTVQGCEWAEKRVVWPKARLGGTTSESYLEHLPL